MTPILVFDIETIPDVDGLRRVWGLAPDVSEAAVVDLATQRRRQATGNDFLPHYLQRVVAISCVLREGTTVRAWSLGSPEESEAFRRITSDDPDERMPPDSEARRLTPEQVTDARAGAHTASG